MQIHIRLKLTGTLNLALSPRYSTFNVSVYEVTIHGHRGSSIFSSLDRPYMRTYIIGYAMLHPSHYGGESNPNLKTICTPTHLMKNHIYLSLL